MEFTAEFNANKKVKFSGSSFFKNISDSCVFFYFVFKKAKCIILLDINEDFIIEGVPLLKQIAFIEAERIADIISWEYEIALRDGKIYLNNPYNLKIPPFQEATDAKFVYHEIFTGKVTEENLEILSGFRQMKNEKSRPLQYLMCYRLLEMFSRHYKGHVDKLISAHKIKTIFIKDKRDPNKRKSLITHFRNKIHPTKRTYLFPSNILASFVEEIERVVVIIIADIIQ
jgi:hypothetical protein